MDTKLNLINYKGQLPSWLESLTLEEAYELIEGDSPSSIPFLVWLLENPDSLLALPGKIRLRDHDCLHLLLNKGFSLEDEAFIIGFTMGNDLQINKLYFSIFKIASLFFYPYNYQFQFQHIKALDLGFIYGKCSTIKNINQINFQIYFSKKIVEVRSELGINLAGMIASY